MELTGWQHSMKIVPKISGSGAFPHRLQSQLPQATSNLWVHYKDHMVSLVSFFQLWSVQPRACCGFLLLPRLTSAAPSAGVSSPALLKGIGPVSVCKSHAKNQRTLDCQVWLKKIWSQICESKVGRKKNWSFYPNPQEFKKRQHLQIQGHQ